MSRPFIVAEMSANHLGSLDRALRIVEAAARAGADAIKVQTWKPGTMCVSDYRMDSGPWAGRLLRDLYEEAHLPWAWHEPIFKASRSLGIEPFSAAFDMESVDFLEALGVARHKVASFEITDLPLIRYMAGKCKPVILSGGAATHEDMEAAINTVGFYSPLVELRCVSEYPADPASFGLGRSFHAREGLSDHSRGIGVAVAAAAKGACYIEKHITLSRADGGPDASFSMEPDEFTLMVDACHQAAAATSGNGKPREPSMLRRSLWVVRPIAQGEPFVLGHNVRTARPALGVHCDTPLRGKSAAHDIEAGQPLTPECIA